MPTKEKLLEKVTNGTHSTNMDELRKLMKHFGFEEKKTSHGYLFTHQQLTNIILPHVAKPHRGGTPVKINYVKECLSAIDLLFKIGENTK